MHNIKLIGVVILIVFGLLSYINFVPIQTMHLDGCEHREVVDRYGGSLRVSYLNRWNVSDRIELYQVPVLIKDAFIVAEDHRFFSHKGVDWLARVNALALNVRKLSAVRGASTISEQVVRIIHPRPRTVWSRWIEGLVAQFSLERNFSKEDIFEFYLNQVHYAANRRGIKQASQYYFGRNIYSLNAKEMLALAILVRRPSGLDVHKNPHIIDRQINLLAERMYNLRLISAMQLRVILDSKLRVESPVKQNLESTRFVEYVLSAFGQSGTRLITTLDPDIQHMVSGILNNVLQTLAVRKVHNMAALVLDHTNGEILAWTVLGDQPSIDAVLTPRQPGSVLKPLLYALSLEHGWESATIISDTPIAESAGYGVHDFHNYSRRFYGDVTLRDALGNSLNIPAIRALNFVGVNNYLEFLRSLGFANLIKDASYYQLGLALGNGEVSLFEIVQAFTILAQNGEWVEMHAVPQPVRKKRVISQKVASVISDILSDPTARVAEFGESSILRMPVQTAVKTGTSSDNHDGWAIGYDSRYLVGVWVGNLNRRLTDGITGTNGAGLALHSIFSKLHLRADTVPFKLSDELRTQFICVHSKLRGCYTEYFIHEEPLMFDVLPFRLVNPVNGTEFHIDPRVKLSDQAVMLRVEGVSPKDIITWYIDNLLYQQSEKNTLLWYLSRGEHVIRVELTRDDKVLLDMAKVVVH